MCIPIQRVPLGFSSGKDTKELSEDIFPLLGFLAGSAASGAPAGAPVGAPALHDNSLALRHDRRRTRTLEGGGWGAMAGRGPQGGSVVRLELGAHNSSVAAGD